MMVDGVEWRLGVRRAGGNVHLPMPIMGHPAARLIKAIATAASRHLLRPDTSSQPTKETTHELS